MKFECREITGTFLSLCKADGTVLSPFKGSCLNLQITPFQFADDEYRKTISQIVESEWNTSDIEKRWFGGLDIFYILHNNSECMGCCAIDTQNFFPYISHLYILPKFRKQKFGTALLDFCATIVKKASIDTVHLWCSNDLIEYYKDRGWQHSEEKATDSNQNLLKKMI